MQQRQSNRTIEFEPDSETLKIIEGKAQAERDKYINDAIKAFSAVSAAQKEAKRPENSTPAELVMAEIERIFGGTCDTIKASAADSADYVVLCEATSQLRVKCGIKDTLDILKSLRQPITVKEVWEIMSVLG